MKETTMRMIFSTRVTALTQVETRATPADISVPNISTGNPVPIANTAGSAMPPVDLRDKGINTPKNRIALYGQKARAKIAPNGNPPIIPQSATFPPIEDSLPPPRLTVSLSMLSIISPITIRSGPKTLCWAMLSL